MSAPNIIHYDGDCCYDREDVIHLHQKLNYCCDVDMAMPYDEAGFDSLESFVVANFVPFDVVGLVTLMAVLLGMLIVQ
jgi:hypothetical protein